MNGQGYFVFILQRFCSGTKNVLMLKRKEAENPIDYFDKNFTEYKEGFKSNGKY